MSRTADIDLTFVLPVTVAEVLGALEPYGWGVVEPLGVSYMLEGDDDWDWTFVEAERGPEVVAMLDSEGVREQAVALSVYHPEARTGGKLLFFRERTTLAFSPVLDRREIPAAPQLTDMAWYLQHLVHPLIEEGLVGYELRDMLD
jgi:hypothetical protein